LTLETGRYTDFSAHLHEKVVARRAPLNVTIEMTRRCPLDCSHCYNNLPMGDLEAKSGELTTEEHLRLLDDLADAGCLWLCYTGGEIFARRDFLEIYTYAKRKGFIITLFTNATIVTPKIADHLKEWRPFSIEVTLYGRTRETYERLTRVPGSYDRCLNGVRLLTERGLPVSMKTVAVTVNKHEVWEMKRFVERELGLPFKFDAMMTPRIDCSQSPLAVRLTPEEIVDLDVQDDGRIVEWGRFSGHFIGPTHPAGLEDELYSCGGGVNSCAVDPQGKMSICVLSHFDTYDLRTGSITDGFDYFLQRVRGKRMTRVTKCTCCHLKGVCGMCPATAELETGDPESPVDFLCHTTHLRAYTFDWTVRPHGDCEYCPGGARHEEVAGAAAVLRERIGRGERAPQPGPVLLPSLGGSEALPVSGCATGACGGCPSH
jgi:MoaA/NifB/PqqE/SkfB family radical SAM enzyme